MGIVKKAKTDIKVFKILEEFNGRCVAPWHRIYTYKRGKNYPDDIIDGWLSSFDDEEHAKVWRDLLASESPEKTYSIYEMIIPKGTQYTTHIMSHELRAKTLSWIL